MLALIRLLKQQNCESGHPDLLGILLDLNIDVSLTLCSFCLQNFFSVAGVFIFVLGQSDSSRRVVVKLSTDIIMLSPLYAKHTCLLCTHHVFLCQ